METTTTESQPRVNFSNLVSINEYASIVKKSRRTIYNWIEEGKLKPFTFQNRQFLDKTQLVFKKD